jgi:hypothetical protein
MTISLAFLAPKLVRAAVEGRLQTKQPLIIDLTELSPDALLRRVVFRPNEPPYRARSCNCASCGAYSNVLLQVIGRFEMPLSDRSIPSVWWIIPGDAKLVELFDAYGVSFVSVTQQFNTTTSMGRLTLNVLLSFAQFEREVTSERIRDKIAASKRKGLWVGGPLPLGYDMNDDKIAVVEEEAEQVRLIYRRYLELSGCRQRHHTPADARVVSPASRQTQKKHLSPM